MQASQTTMHTSATPRFLTSVSTCSRYLAPSPPSPATAQEVALAVHGHAQRDVDGPVGHAAVADLHVDRVDEDDRVDRVQRPRLPGGQASSTRSVMWRWSAGRLGAVDLGQVRLHLAGGQALGDQETTRSSTPPRRRWRLRTMVAGSCRRGHGGHLELDWADVGEHRLGAGAPTGVAAVAAGRVALGVARMVGQLASSAPSSTSLVTRCSSPPGPTRLMPCERAWATSRAASCSSTASVCAPVAPWAAGLGSSTLSCGVSSGVPSAHSVTELHHCIYSPHGRCGDSEGGAVRAQPAMEASRRGRRWLGR